MCSPDPRQGPSTEPERPKFVPGQTKKSFGYNRFVARFRYYLKSPANSLIALVAAGFLVTAAATNSYAYYGYGPEHPTNRFQWKRMKARGELTPEMLHKEKVLLAYYESFITEPREPITKMIRTV